MRVEGPNGQELAVINKTLTTPLRDRWTGKLKIGPDLDVEGNS